MGMFDTIWVDKQILEDYKIVCPQCRQYPKDFQTKAFDSSMDSYYLKMVALGTIRLFKLDDPVDKKFWHEYTQEELDEHNKKEDLWMNNAGISPFYRHPGDGYWNSEAWLPENRYQRFMGELPHQWATIYTTCPHCKSHTWMEYRIKFTDGVAETIEKKEEK